MPNIKFGTALLAAFLMAGSGPSQAQQTSQQQAQPSAKARPGVVELRQMANQAFSSKDYPGFRQAMVQLHQQRPNNSEYMYQLVLAHALMDEKSAAFNIMLQMQRQGLSYDFLQSPESETLRDAQLFGYLNDLMIQAGQPMGAATPVVDLEADILLPEAIEWDPQRNAFLIGTVRDGTITSVSIDGNHRELVRADDSNGVWGIYDLVVDIPRNRLWASSASSPQFSGYNPVDKGRSVLLEFNLTSMELIRRYPVPVDGRPHSLGNMALAPNGDLYISDRMLPVVYVKEADEERLKPFFASRGMVSLRGLDTSDDGSRLYIADYEMGIIVIDLTGGKSYKLEVPETLNLGGIEGVYYWKGHLAVIQNGIKPQRIMVLKLDQTGIVVSEVAPLAVALEIMDSPSYGTVVGDQLYFFANSHWGRSGDDIKPVTIAGTSLAEAPAIMEPDAELFMKKYEEAQKRGNVRAAPGLVPPPQAIEEAGPEEDSEDESPPDDGKGG